MKRWFALCFCAFAIAAWGGDWRDTLTPVQPGAFPPPRPLKATYKFGWSGLAAAQAEFDFSTASPEQLRLVVRAKSTGAVSALWRMDAQHTAVCDAATLRPISVQQTEIYKTETEVTSDVFFPTEVRRLTRVTPSAEPPEKERRFKCADVFDLHTALLFIRSQRLARGDRYRLIVYPWKGGYLAEIEVLGSEKVSVGGRKYDAIKCQLRLQGITKKLELEPHRKFKRAFAWLSDDRDRMLLKIQADIFVGSVWAELQSVEYGGP